MSSQEYVEIYLYSRCAFVACCTNTGTSSISYYRTFPIYMSCKSISNSPVYIRRQNTVNIFLRISRFLCFKHAAYYFKSSIIRYIHEHELYCNDVVIFSVHFTVLAVIYSLVSSKTSLKYMYFENLRHSFNQFN
jgi:hypothetical protein